VLFQIQRDIATILSPFFVSDGLVKRCLEYAETLEHIMDFTRSGGVGLWLELGVKEI
jgi:dynein heavy chain 1